MTLANWVTLSRLIMAPFIFWLWLKPEKWLIGIVFLIVSGLTDLLDGAVARKRNEVSDLGKVLDPIADKAVFAGVLAALTIRGFVPAFLVWIYLAKELFQLFGGAFILTRFHRVVPSNIWGKSSSVLFYLGIFAVFVHRELGLIIICLGLALSIIALITYMKASVSPESDTTQS